MSNPSSKNYAAKTEETKVKGGVDAVDRALRIVRCCADSESNLGLTALAQRSNLYKSTVLRLITSLKQAGLIEQLPDKTYKLGPEVIRLSAAYHRSDNFEENVRPVLQSIVSQTGESASLHKLNDGQRLCLFRENSNQGLRDHVVEGSTQPIKLGGASSRVLTKFQNIKCTEIPSQLFKALPMFSFGEPNAGVFAVSMPVFNRWCTLEGALTISGPTSRLTAKKLFEFANLLVQKGNELSGKLGAPGGIIIKSELSKLDIENLLNLNE